MEARKYYIFKYCCIFGIIIFGSLSIIGKAALKTRGIYYPIFQTSFLFVGEMLSLIVFWIKFKVLKLRHDQNFKYDDLQDVHQNWITKLGNWAYMIAGTCEFLGSFLETIAYNYLSPPSIVSLKCLTTVFILYYRFFHINRTVFKHQKLGLAIYSIGIILIIAEVIAEKTSADVEISKIVCIILMFFAEAFTALNMIFMEYLINKFNTTTEIVNWIKGATGFALCLFTFIPIGYLLKVMFTNYSFYTPFNELLENKDFLYISISLVFISYFLSDVVCRTLKFSETLTVVTVESGKIVFVWALELAFRNEISVLEILGGVFIILGLLIFNEVIIIPFFGLKKSAKESMEQNKMYKRQKAKKNNITDALFMSPFESLSEK